MEITDTDFKNGFSLLLKHSHTIFMWHFSRLARVIPYVLLDYAPTKTHL